MSADKTQPQSKIEANVEANILRLPDVEQKAYYSESDYLDMELERKIRQEYLITLKNNNLERVNYAKKTFALTVVWIILVLAIVVLNGFKISGLSDAVLITLISTTTINVFGFFLLVIKYLFNTGAGGIDNENRISLRKEPD